jgi:nucleoside-diphosphate-sugar epimerase
LVIRFGNNKGVYSFAHVDNAAGAAAAALECPLGAYNIVDGNPSAQDLWLAVFAHAAGAPSAFERGVKPGNA